MGTVNAGSIVSVMMHEQGYRSKGRVRTPKGTTKIDDNPLVEGVSAVPVE
jgi:hypothetical protein